MTARSRTGARGGIAATGILSVALAAGCTVGGSSGEPAGRTSTAGQALLGICEPLTCCFPSGGGWAESPFDDRLQALGCTVPKAYTESFGRSQWWLYSACPSSLELADLVLQYALVSPYYSQLVVNECLELQALGDGQPTWAFVEWDPTCSSCRYPDSF
jgi:hypothetical protein